MGLINNKLALLMGTTVAITSTLLTNTKVKADTDANSSSKEVTVQNDNQSTNSINTQKVTLQNQSTKNEDSSVDTKSVVSNTETSNDQVVLVKLMSPVLLHKIVWKVVALIAMLTLARHCKCQMQVDKMLMNLRKL